MVVTGARAEVERAAHGRFTRGDAASLVRAAWRTYPPLVATLSVSRGAGAALNLRLAALTLALYRALTAHGTAPEYARELVADATWSVYERYGRVTGFISRRLGRVLPARLAARVRDDDNMARRLNPDGTVRLYFPFDSPEYRAVRVPATEGIAFDMVRCPVAAFFRNQGEPRLCLAAWCNLDYALAEMGGRHLVRTKSLAAGDERCDFRFLPGACAVPRPRASCPT